MAAFSVGGYGLLRFLGSDPATPESRVRLHRCGCWFRTLFSGPPFAGTQIHWVPRVDMGAGRPTPEAIDAADVTRRGGLPAVQRDRHRTAQAWIGDVGEEPSVRQGTAPAGVHRMFSLGRPEAEWDGRRSLPAGEGDPSVGRTNAAHRSRGLLAVPSRFPG